MFGVNYQKLSMIRFGQNLYSIMIRKTFTITPIY